MSPVSSRRWALLAVAGLVVLAGCPVGFGASPESTAEPVPTGSPTGPSAPTVTPEQTATPPSSATPTPTSGTDNWTPAPTPRPGPSATPTPVDATPLPRPTVEQSNYAIPVRGNGSLPSGVNVNRTYARTLALLDLEGIEPPTQLYLQETDTPWRPAIRDEFARTLIDGRETTTFSGETRSGITLSNVGNQSALAVRFTLVHEFVHHLQFQRVDDSTAFRAMGTGRDGVHGDAAFAIVEGSASYVALEYVRTFTNHTRAAVLNATDEYRNASPAGKYVWGPYHFGRRYANARVGDPAEHWRLYEHPPHTTEELIHARAPGSEPVAPLSVSVEAEDWSADERASRGELFVRYVLAAELPEGRAARGAAGWGNDRVVHVATGNGTGYAWAVRWDDAANATEFANALRAAMDERADRVDGVWSVDEGAVDVRRVAPETVVVFTGPEPFVRAATAGSENGTVTVTRGR